MRVYFWAYTNFADSYFTCQSFLLDDSLLIWTTYSTSHNPILINKKSLFKLEDNRLNTITKIIEGKIFSYILIKVFILITYVNNVFNWS